MLPEQQPDLCRSSNSSFFESSSDQSDIYEYIPKDEPVRPPRKDQIVVMISTPFTRLHNPPLSDSQPKIPYELAQPTQAQRFPLTQIAETIIKKQAPTQRNGLEIDSNKAIKQVETFLVPAENAFRSYQPATAEDNSGSSKNTFSQLKPSLESNLTSICSIQCTGCPDCGHYQPSLHGVCRRDVDNLHEQLRIMREILEEERTNNEMEIKANQVYSANFEVIEKACQSYCGISPEDLGTVTDRLIEVLKKYSQYESSNKLNQSKQSSSQAETRYEEKIAQMQEIIEHEDQTIRSLRAELLTSSQNNINAIFNTEFTEENCLHMQVKKINTEIMKIKENLSKVTVNNASNSRNTATKIVKIYANHKGNLYSQDSDEQNDDDYVQGTVRNVAMAGKKKSKINKHPHARKASKSIDSQNSNHSKTKRYHNDQRNTQMNQIVESYRALHEDYNSLQRNIFAQTNFNSLELKNLFAGLRGEIVNVLASKVQQKSEVEQIHSHEKEALDCVRLMEKQLLHLKNTMHKPEIVNRESFEEANENVFKADLVRQVKELEVRNNRLEILTAELTREKNVWQEEAYRLRELNGIHQEKTMEMWYNDDAKKSFTIAHSKLLEDQVAILKHKITRLEELVRLKTVRVQELQATLFDSMQSKRRLEGFERYETTISNLKLLLNESRRQTELSKAELKAHLSTAPISNTHLSANLPMPSQTELTPIQIDRTVKQEDTWMMMNQFQSEESLDDPTASRVFLQIFEKSLEHLYEVRAKIKGISKFETVDYTINSFLNVFFVELKECDQLIFNALMKNKLLSSRMRNNS